MVRNAAEGMGFSIDLRAYDGRRTRYYIDVPTQDPVELGAKWGRENSTDAPRGCRAIQVLPAEPDSTSFFEQRFVLDDRSRQSMRVASAIGE
jgi:hypothetical protein